MPEYLAPGVYVEEIPSSNKPIQAASTSTAGMVGMTERGPINRLTLVTSLGDYNRQFGGDLNPLAFVGSRDALPYAAEGFFANGGSRLYVVRIVGAAANESELALVAQDTAIAASPIILANARANDTTLLVDNPGALAADDRVLVVDGTASEEVVIDAAAFEPWLAIGGGLANTFPAASTATVQTPNAIAGVLTADLAAGDTDIVLDDVTGLANDQVLLLADAADLDEFVTIAAIDVPTATITLAASLASPHAAASVLNRLDDTATVATLDDGVNPSAAAVFADVDSAAGIAVGDVVRLDDNAGTQEFAFVTALPRLITLADPLANDHAPGVPLTPAAPVLTVHAQWPGVWGDALRVTAGAAALVETVTTAIAPAGATTVTVATAFGLFPGSVIVFDNGIAAEVADVDTVHGIVTLATGLTDEVALGAAVTSQEFSLTVERMRDGKVVESEFFDRLSMSSEHPRYALKIVGSWDPGADRPSDSGASDLIRLSDEADATTRLLPLIPGVPRMLAGGDDDVGAVNGASYVGNAAVDPDARTGIQALENEPTISIVAVPGQTEVTVQKALIAHCEKMRYRFAVLDTPLGTSLAGARTHRQNFDTTRAAVYYPGLVIADRFGDPGDRRAIAPSGHVIGVYARTDIARGVHKAPANEVVRGILGFETALTKGEQDILNPINLNCMRDFRSENRGLRIYGARVVTSDPEWKYINVRRLLLFIEQSLDTGLQWAVFEPNEQPLWDTVKQSITGFLTTVWRSGALEGAKREEAFFVNIGYGVTMTQDDIDNGRLIVEVGVAPVKPAEFVIVHISQKTREATA